MNCKGPVKSVGAQRGELAFTMIEIAISLAVIGFALVAIIGILPSGMSVQKENRQETVITQDASVFLNAIRGGLRGLDDLTNYVVAITNYVTEIPDTGRPRISGPWAYTYASSFDGNTEMSPPLRLTNGLHIVGLLSTPKYIPFTSGQTFWVRSNYVVATVRSLSGPASEKAPQLNADIHDLTFTYRMYPEFVPFSGFDRSWTNFTDPLIAGLTNEIVNRSNSWRLTLSMQTNVYDLRLRFRWPVLPNGNVGNGLQNLRTELGGHLLGPTNEPWFPLNDSRYSLYFFQPRSYVRAQ